MGLAPTAAAVIIFVLTTAAVMTVLEAQMEADKSLIDLGERARILERNIKSDIQASGFNSTNTTETLINTTLYVINSGTVPMLTDCVDLYINGSWVAKHEIEAVVVPDRFNPHLWNPSETLLISFALEMPVGEHSAKIISCTGKSEDMLFNASKCGDGICHGGEYCEKDSIACDLLCYDTECMGGCVQTLTPAGERDSFGHLFCDETGGCITGDCVCDGEGGCCGAQGSECTNNNHCCSGLCISETNACAPYP
jgi:archaellum component FlaG (FlaF/FlaG flagellin family)